MSFLWGLLVGLFVGVNLGVIVYAIIVYNKTKFNESGDCGSEYEKN